MSELLKNLLNSAKKAELSHGIHENCVITEVNIGGRKSKTGELINRNCFTKITKLDKNDKPVGEKEISWFNLDFQNEYVKDTFTNQMLQMTNILECYITSEDVNNLFDKIFAEFEIVDEKTLEDIITDKENCKNLMDDICKAYIQEMNNHTGVDSTKMRVKLSYDSKGKNVQQPKYGIFVEKMDVDKEDSKLKFSKNEIEYEFKAQNFGAVPDSNTKTNMLKI